MTSALTGSRPTLPGQGYIAFLHALAEQLHTPRDTADSTGLLVVHLNNLNRINATLGYRKGQQVSVDFAAQMQKLLRDKDWLTQISEARYAVVLDRVKNSGHMMLAANRVAQIAAKFPISDDSNLNLEIRVGAAMYPEQASRAEDLLRNAELAIETAARQGSTFAVFHLDESENLTNDWNIEAQIANGLENNEFSLFYQPKIDAVSLMPCAAEGLMRWFSPSLGQVSTERFIQIIEDTDHIDELTNFALHTAARDLSEWAACAPDLTVAVNLAPKVLEHGNIVSSFKHVAGIWGVSLERFTAEVTENGIMSTAGTALDVLQALRDEGIRVSIDDFGTGNSSLAYFKDIPADEVKIDKSFVFKMLEDESNHRLVKTIIDLAHSFDLKVVAEGVETADCVSELQKLGCDVFQGYYFSKPMPEREFFEYLKNNAATDVKQRVS
jgi:diguanylate cyclase (GGDEF)-like protein